jgi:predicted RNase H-like nuclease (RuvC/YqgF family)
MTKKHQKHRKATPYSQIINPIHHLEKTVEKLDKENDRLQNKVMILTMLSTLLAATSIVIALFVR